MKKFALMFLGVVIMFASIWSGAYFGSIYPRETWQAIPVFFTWVIFFLFGCLCIAIGIEYKDKK